MLGVLPCDCKMPRDSQRDMHVYGCIQRLAICAADSVLRKEHVPGGVHKTHEVLLLHAEHPGC
jgi:hypothetical protein